MSSEEFRNIVVSAAVTHSLAGEIRLEAFKRRCSMSKLIYETLEAAFSKKTGDVDEKT